MFSVHLTPMLFNWLENNYESRKQIFCLSKADYLKKLFDEIWNDLCKQWKVKCLKSNKGDGLSSQENLLCFQTKYLKLFRFY